MRPERISTVQGTRRRTERPTVCDESGHVSARSGPARSTDLHRCTRYAVILPLICAASSLSLLGCSGDEGAATLPARQPATAPKPDPATETETSTTRSVSPSTATSSAPTVEAAKSTEEETIIGRYRGYWIARLNANMGTPNPQAPGLREYATGEQLATVLAETQANLDEGLALRSADEPADLQRIEVIEIDGDRATVQECVVSDGVVIRRESGEVVDDQVATHNVRGELLKVDGVWKVTSARLVQRWEGVAGCALDS